MKRLAQTLCLSLITLLVTHCEKHQTTYDNKDMSHNDLEFRFVMSTYDQVNEDIREKGWDQVSGEQRTLANVIIFYSKIEIGGFGGFYFDSEHLPEMLNEIASSLHRVGANRAEELLRLSTQKFEGGVVPVGMDARIAVAQTYPDDFDPFEELDELFYSESESYISLLATYIRANPSTFK